MWARRLEMGLGAAVCAAALVLTWCCSAADAATLKVTTTHDGLGGGGCTLRAAVQAVDAPGVSTSCGTAGSGSNRIVLRAGLYRLSIAPRGADDNSSGDLDLRARHRVEIVGSRRSATVIDSVGLGDRVLSVSGPGRVTVGRLTITGGSTATPAPGPSGTDGMGCLEGGSGGDGRSAADGGGIYNAGTLTLKRVSVTGNATGTGGAGGAGGAEKGTTSGCPGGAGGHGGNGGGLFNLGRLTIVNSSIQTNRTGAGGAGGAGGGDSSGTGGRGGSGGEGGSGGGIYNLGALSVQASTISGNQAGAGAWGGGAQGSAGRGAGGAGGLGGGIFSASGPLGVTNSTFVGNFAGAGGGGGELSGPGGPGGSGGAIQVSDGASTVQNATVAHNGVGAGGASARDPGARGSGGGISVNSQLAAYDMRLENTIVTSSIGSGCAAKPSSAITDAGHNLSFGDRTCPGVTGNPKLGALKSNGGPTETMALRSASAAIGRVPRSGGSCPARDQRGARRPQGRRCDIGAFEFARPAITLITPRARGSYERHSRVRVRFRCGEGGLAGLIVTCRATLAPGRLIDTRSVGSRRFTVTAKDRAGRRTVRTVRYSVWEYVNPMRAVQGLHRERIDMGVDYGGSGPILALGSGRVLAARDDDSGPSGCVGGFCWPGGGLVVYRLSEGPFAGKYVYVAENITVSVRAGQTVRAGQRIAVLHPEQPDMETGWASSRIGRPLALVRGDQCPCGDPGGWSSIEGRNFNRLLVALGAPSGNLQPSPPLQSMPRGWPTWP